MVIPSFLIILASNVCPVEKDVKCCVDCEARFLICQKNSDSLTEKMNCLQRKRQCQERCSSKKD
ncbi:hypothetical protein [Candidatus Odyssella thessalonicensis]|uniref:hypothetical protein n=1 Tax=Candidatus Odyssella thessalonicensis TaxID=84647 RepID=UPI001112C43A|nr:hypothetical protein [Candidatus Odyssella thessalonicensis]